MYRDGTGVKKNYAWAFRYYREAAYSGLASAQYNLAGLYLEVRAKNRIMPGLYIGTEDRRKRDIRLPRYKWEICTIVEKG